MPDALPATSWSRHDLLLAVVAAPLLVAALLGGLLPVPLHHALAAGSVPAGGGVGYALFYRPPVDSAD